MPPIFLSLPSFFFLLFPLSSFVYEPVLQFWTYSREYDKYNTVLCEINGNCGKSRHLERAKLLDLQCRDKATSLCRSDNRQFKTPSCSVRGETKEAKVNEYSAGKCRKEENWPKGGQRAADRQNYNDVVGSSVAFLADRVAARSSGTFQCTSRTRIFPDLLLDARSVYQNLEHSLIHTVPLASES